ncbi:MAG: Kae1-associated kinase Bud32 [ANME-2 cluster archaeon]|nr:Kae1-associated kinase Bud32 [ANME-2 cluster archaeon]
MFLSMGAEATIELRDGMVIKKRLPKGYRLEALDNLIRRDRTRTEARLTSESRRNGVPTPIIYDIEDFDITMEYIEGPKIKDIITPRLSSDVGAVVGKLHTANIIHGDLTTSNMILHNGRIYLIDFGLAYYDNSVEAQGVDIHVLFQTYESTHNDHEELISAFSQAYRQTFSGADAVLERVTQIERRGRYA